MVAPSSIDHPLSHVLAIVGPTASGKSALSMALASQVYCDLGKHIEIISMDSALVYKGMDIGTAKPNQNELQQIPHHGINICEPWEVYSAAQFTRDAAQWGEEIRGRGNIPIIVGGTMLYWRALTQGLTDLPPADPLLRKEMEDHAKLHGWESIHERLAELDPITAARLPIGDTQRIQRALEVVLTSGKPMSAFLEESPYASTRDDSNLPHQLISLEPQERSWLHERIAFRFAQMLEQDFLSEMKTLKSNPLIHAELPSMRAVGYRQAWEYLEDQISFEEFREKSIIATRQLAKRQLTWLRAMPTRKKFDPSNTDEMKHALDTCMSYIKNSIALQAS
jgi:tRNA dimethylallyltransferase